MESEDERHLNREMRTIKAERTAHNNRIKGLLVTQGVTTVAIDRQFVERLDLYQTPAGKPLGTRLKERLTREFERMALATEQIRRLQMQQATMIRQANKEPEGCSPAAMIAGRLCSLSGIGPVTSWTLSTEIFSWRDISNRRQLAALVGLVPTPHSSGDDEREQGISKSGRAELRDFMIEIAWGWLRFQPDSELTKWYQRRFDDGTKRNRKIGIVAVARKLLEWILGHAPYVIPSASAIESLATFGPTKVVGLGGRYANRTASPVLGGGMRIKRRIGPQTLGGLRITAERSTATATGMTTGA
jgi:transposase